MASGELTDAGFLAFNEAWIAAVLPYLCEARRDRVNDAARSPFSLT
jgi:hypothetical protein